MPRHQLLSAHPRPTAIIYDNDIMAVAGLGVAQELGIAVPTELSVVSFDDSILCEVVRPSLTACARDVEAYGRARSLSLLAMIEGHEEADATRPRRSPPASVHRGQLGG